MGVGFLFRDPTRRSPIRQRQFHSRIVDNSISADFAGTSPVGIVWEDLCVPVARDRRADVGKHNSKACGRLALRRAGRSTTGATMARQRARPRAPADSQAFGWAPRSSRHRRDGAQPCQTCRDARPARNPAAEPQPTPDLYPEPPTHGKHQSYELLSGDAGTPRGGGQAQARACARAGVGWGGGRSPKQASPVP